MDSVICPTQYELTWKCFMPTPEEQSSSDCYKNNCYLLCHTNSGLSSECISLTSRFGRALEASQTKPPKLGVLLSSRLGKQVRMGPSAGIQTVAINTAKSLSTGKVP